MRLAVRIGHFRDGLTAPQLDIDPPDQHTSRGQFDQAVKAERDQADAARHHALVKGDQSLDYHPSNGEPLQPECCPDQQQARRNSRDHHSAIRTSLALEEML